MNRLRQILQLRKHVPKLRGVRQAGGPKNIELISVDEPKGWLLPTSEVTVDVHTKDGGTTRFEQTVPMPPLWTAAYRVGRRLNLPGVRNLDPARLRLKIPIPRRG